MEIRLNPHHFTATGDLKTATILAALETQSRAAGGNAFSFSKSALARMVPGLGLKAISSTIDELIRRGMLLRLDRTHYRFTPDYWKYILLCQESPHLLNLVYVDFASLCGTTHTGEKISLARARDIDIYILYKNTLGNKPILRIGSLPGEDEINLTSPAKQKTPPTPYQIKVGIIANGAGVTPATAAGYLSHLDKAIEGEITEEDLRQFYRLWQSKTINGQPALAIRNPYTLAKWFDQLVMIPKRQTKVPQQSWWEAVS